MCGAPVADEHQHVVNVGTRSLLCTCRPCYLLFTHDDADAGLPRGARPLPVASRRSRPRCGRSSSCPVGTAFLFLNSALDRVVAFYPGPAGATESELPLEAWEPGRRRAPPALATLQPDVEALLVHAEDGQQVEAFLVPDRRLLRAGRAPAPALARLRRRAGRPARGWTSSSTRSAPAARPAGTRDRAGVRGPRRARRSSTPRRRTCCSGCGVTETSGAVVHAIALRCQLRIEPQRRPYDAGRAGGARRPVRHLRPLREHPQAVPVDPRDRDGAGIRGVAGVRPAGAPAPTTSTSARTKYLHALRGGDVPLVLLFSGTVFTRGETGFASSSCPGRWRPPAGCRSRTWRQLMDHYFPGGGWVRLDRETIDALARYRAGPRPDLVGADARRAAPGGGGRAS